MHRLHEHLRIERGAHHKEAGVGKLPRKRRDFSQAVGRSGVEVDHHKLGSIAAAKQAREGITVGKLGAQMHAERCQEIGQLLPVARIGVDNGCVQLDVHIPSSESGKVKEILINLPS